MIPESPRTRRRLAGDDAVSLGLEGAAHFEPVVPGSGVWPKVRETILDLVAGGRRNNPDR